MHTLLTLIFNFCLLLWNGQLRESNIVLAQGGRGSNWAYGYNEHWTEESNSLLQQTMKDVCREVERIDYYGGGVLLHSLSGGTGSGFSSKLCEEICDTFPAGHILIVSVAPHQIEESPVQHYNTLLSLASLQSRIPLCDEYTHCLMHGWTSAACPQPHHSQCKLLMSVVSPVA
uniref:Tubulin/FtsZ GTPase domain-containing protein n=1 Tax=Hucho hucho TaxID=62062 RepID=A0A4W5RVY1_9TELE